MYACIFTYVYMNIQNVYGQGMCSYRLHAASLAGRKQWPFMAGKECRFAWGHDDASTTAVQAVARMRTVKPAQPKYGCGALSSNRTFVHVAILFESEEGRLQMRTHCLQRCIIRLCTSSLQKCIRRCDTKSLSRAHVEHNRCISRLSCRSDIKEMCALNSFGVYATGTQTELLSVYICVAARCSATPRKGVQIKVAVFVR